MNIEVGDLLKVRRAGEIFDAEVIQVSADGTFIARFTKDIMLKKNEHGEIEEVLTGDIVKDLYEDV